MNKKKGTQPELNFEEQGVNFGENFLEQLVGKKMLTNPLVAIIELIANCWDSGATKVKIQWGNTKHPIISILDNGEGMTKEELLHRWNTLSYNRLKEQGNTVSIIGSKDLPKRRVYGTNGIGRFAAFCFNNNYNIETCKNNIMSFFEVKRLITGNKPHETHFVKEMSSLKNGTKIIIENLKSLQYSEEALRTEIAMRFLGDPNFNILVNNNKVKLFDIPDKNIKEINKKIDELGSIDFKIINTTFSDRTMKMHGIAFQVNGRLVGDINWKHKGIGDTVDGRRLEGKRLLVIVQADFLLDAGIIKSDWTGFEEEDEKYKKLIKCVRDTIGEYLEEYLREDRENTYRDAYKKSEPYFSKITYFQKDVWENFIQEVLKTCRSIGHSDIIKLAELLAKLEAASSKYALLSQLADQTPGDLDNLHKILNNWTIQTAKSVLDEIKTRMVLLEELKIKTADDTTAEVQELQPLFANGLWIFGPEFESIHFTSNQTMNSVIQKLLKNKASVSGSANRPDFIILPDGSCGCYSMPEFGRLGEGDSGEIGVAKLVLVELKKPQVPLGGEEKDQCWKYYKELKLKGCISESTKVDCFLLGKVIKPGESNSRSEGNCNIKPFVYDTIIKRAESRLFYLDKKIRSAPFMQEIIEKDEQSKNIASEVQFS